MQASWAPLAAVLIASCVTGALGQLPSEADFECCGIDGELLVYPFDCPPDRTGPIALPLNNCPSDLVCCAPLVTSEDCCPFGPGRIDLSYAYSCVGGGTAPEGEGCPGDPIVCCGGEEACCTDGLVLNYPFDCPDGSEQRPVNPDKYAPCPSDLVCCEPKPAPPLDSPLPRNGWTAIADSEETRRENGRARNVLDDQGSTIWHSRWSRNVAQLPHTIEVVFGGNSYHVSGLRYTPRQNGHNGNIGEYEVYTRSESGEWVHLAGGEWPDDQTVKTVTWSALSGQTRLRLVAKTEAGGRGPWSSIAELEVLGY